MHYLPDLEVALGYERLELLLQRRRLERGHGLEAGGELAQQRGSARRVQQLVELRPFDGQRIVGDEELAELQDVAHRLDTVAGRTDDARGVGADARGRRRRHETRAL